MQPVGDLRAEFGRPAFGADAVVGVGEPGEAVAVGPVGAVEADMKRGLNERGDVRQSVLVTFHKMSAVAPGGGACRRRRAVRFTFKEECKHGDEAVQAAPL